MKKQNKKHQNAESIGEKLKTNGEMFFFNFFHVIYKISKVRDQLFLGCRIVGPNRYL